MDNKIVAQLDDNGVFLGEVVLDDSDRSPLEPDKWLLPKGCIETLPKKDISPNIVAIWLDGEYVYQEKDTLMNAKEALSDEMKIAAINMENDAAEYARKVRNELLTETDYTQLPDIPKKVRDEYKPYRKALRDLTNQKGWPLDIKWPIHPDSKNNI